MNECPIKFNFSGNPLDRAYGYSCYTELLNYSNKRQGYLYEIKKMIERVIELDKLKHKHLVKRHKIRRRYGYK